MRHLLPICLIVLALAATGTAARVATRDAAAGTPGSTATVAVSVTYSPRYHRITYRGARMTASAAPGAVQAREGGLVLQAVALPGTAVTIKIQHLTKTPKNLDPVEGQYLYLPDSSRIDRIDVTGDVASFYTDTSIGQFRVAGSVGSVATKNATVASITADGSIKSVRMASTPTGSNPQWAITHVATSGSADQPLSISLQGIVLEGLETTQPISVLSSASKAFRPGRGARPGIAIGGLGRITPDAVADTTGTYTLAAGAFGTITTKAASIRPDELVGLSPIQKVSGKSLVLQGTPCPAMLGWEGEPMRLLMRADSFTAISADAGIHGRFWAGHDAQGPTFTGVIGSVTARTGSLAGELCIAPGTRVRFYPAQEEMHLARASQELLGN